MKRTIEAVASSALAAAMLLTGIVTHQSVSRETEKTAGQTTVMSESKTSKKSSPVLLATTVGEVTTGDEVAKGKSYDVKAYGPKSKEELKITKWSLDNSTKSSITSKGVLTVSSSETATELVVWAQDEGYVIRKIKLTVTSSGGGGTTDPEPDDPDDPTPPDDDKQVKDAVIIEDLEPEDIAVGSILPIDLNMHMDLNGDGKPDLKGSNGTWSDVDVTFELCDKDGNPMTYPGGTMFTQYLVDPKVKAIYIGDESVDSIYFKATHKSGNYAIQELPLK